MKTYEKLYTAEGAALSDTPWQVYPRPTMRRDSFLNLCGMWEFSVGPEGCPPEHYEASIRVPFPPESLLSGIDRQFEENLALYYRRTFTLPEGFLRDRVLLHFGAADQVATVSLNGTLLGTHTGGYAPFDFDVTDAIRDGENVLTVCVTDHLDDHILPWGKQKHKRGGMWYTPVSGLWQSVWMESVSAEYIRSVEAETHIQMNEDGSVASASVVLHVAGISEGQVHIKTPDGTLTVPLSDGRASFTLDTPRLWSPEDPYLYEAEVEGAADHVSTYFALRTLEIRTVDGYPRLCLNGKSYFFHGVLDQGYFSDGLFTPADPLLYEKDILAMKALGFNTLRKHIKVEPELFYYDCDKLGMIVFQDMVNNSHYSFLRDTALPTIGIQKLNDNRLHKNPAARRAFDASMEETVRRLAKHPSVCYYTIFNEGWGQFESDAHYKRIKELDMDRFIDATSGWFRGKDSDVESLHIYFKPIKLGQSDRPIVLSEFGGYSFKPSGHVFNKEKTYGYRFFAQQSAFMDALERLYTDEVLPAVKKGLCAAIYTQLSDVEDETNGLLSYDRVVLKADPARMCAIAEKLQRAVEGQDA